MDNRKESPITESLIREQQNVREQHERVTTGARQALKALDEMLSSLRDTEIDLVDILTRAKSERPRKARH